MSVCSRGTGLAFAPKGLQAAPGVLRQGYKTMRMGAVAVSKLQAPSRTQIAREACKKDDIKDPSCTDVLLLLLTPESYSSNNTADTPNRRAFISPSQVCCKLDCSAAAYVWDTGCDSILMPLPGCDSAVTAVTDGVTWHGPARHEIGVAAMKAMSASAGAVYRCKHHTRIFVLP
jgi:hypothetical protein